MTTTTGENSLLTKWGYFGVLMENEESWKTKQKKMNDAREQLRSGGHVNAWAQWLARFKRVQMLDMI